MKHFLPLLAVVAASLAAPVAAQSTDAFAGVERMAARMGMDIPNMAALTRSNVVAPQIINQGTITRGTTFGANQVVIVQNGTVAALSSEPRVLAPTRSLVPVPRGQLLRVETPDAVTPIHVTPITTIAALEAAPMADMADTVAEASRAAPAGANTAVISNGAGTVVVNSAPTRPSLWQRLFGG